MSVEVNTTEYEFSHGKKPRGFGCWAFQIGRDPEPYWSHGNYGQAVKDARKMAVAKKEWLVKVLP